MAFARPKKREPVGEAGLFEYAVGTLARRMRTVRDLRRLTGFWRLTAVWVSLAVESQR